MLILVFSLLVFATVTAAVYAMWSRVSTESPVASRLRQLRTMQAGVRGRMTYERPPLPLAWIARLGGFLPARDGRDAMRTGLVQAGYRRPEAVLIFLGFKLLLAAALPAAWIGIGYLTARPIGNTLLWSIALGVLGFYLPTLFVAWRKQRRHDAIQAALPDALDLMVICVEAGLGIAAALERVAGEIRIASAELSRELRTVQQEMQTGMPRADALRHLARRTGVEDVYMLVAMLIQTDRLGTSVADTLRAHAESMRVRRRQRAEQLARKAGVKLAFPLVFLVLPALLVVILGPAAIQLMKALTTQ